MSELVGHFGVGLVEQPGGGKTVDEALLHVEERDYGPDKRVVELRTSDDWSYRFVRFSPDEPLTPEGRTRPDGSEPDRRGRLPENVSEVRDAISLGELSPPDATTEATDEEVREAVEAVEESDPFLTVTTDDSPEYGEPELVLPDGGTATQAGGETPELAGITVAHTKNDIDTYGGRRRRDGELRHMDNANPPEPGWLGNPFQLENVPAEDDEEARRQAIELFYDYFTDRVAEDDQLRRAVESLRGQTVGCWCRGVTKDRHDDGADWCHLDVVDCWLRGQLDEVREYLGREHE